MVISEVRFAVGLLSCTSDLVQYIKFQLDEKNPLIQLSHESIWKDSYGNDFGLSRIMCKNTFGRRLIYQSGGSFGFNSFLGLYPDLSIGVVLLTNTSDATMEKKLSIIADEICDKLTKK